MVMEIEYQEGLNSLLNRKISLEYVEEVGKEIFYYVAYLIPGVGIYREFKKPKEKRSKLGTIFSVAIAAGFIIKAGLLYGGKVVATGDWHPFRFNQEKKIEKLINKEESKLEKTVDYSEINYQLRAKDL
jgi:hypothetical protein